MENGLDPRFATPHLNMRAAASLQQRDGPFRCPKLAFGSAPARLWGPKTDYTANDGPKPLDMRIRKVSLKRGQPDPIEGGEACDEAPGPPKRVHCNPWQLPRHSPGLPGSGLQPSSGGDPLVTSCTAKPWVEADAFSSRIRQQLIANFSASLVATEFDSAPLPMPHPLARQTHNE
jgi:hypothetical protein